MKLLALCTKDLLLLVLVLCLFDSTAQSPSATKKLANVPIEANRPRVIVLTDITSLDADHKEPDDGQSLIRLMLYSNQIDIEGLIASSHLGHGQMVTPELVHQIINAYENVHPNLVLHDKNYPSPDFLRKKVKAGQPYAMPNLPLEVSIGEGKDTDASEWIIRGVDQNDSRPVWILAWGGTADLAQALWKVKSTRSTEEVARFLSRIRVDASYNQDSAAEWIKSTFPDLFYITRHHGIRGMYRGGDTTLVNPSWVEENIRRTHGALGAAYVVYRGGDLWQKKPGLKGIKEGDTPTFLRLIPNGLNIPHEPTWGSWGGRFEKVEGSMNQYEDAVDVFGNYLADRDNRIVAIYRWRDAYQADFAARLDWCVKLFAAANHAPQNVDLKPVFLKGKIGEAVVIEATGWSDPDHQKISYSWSTYPDVGTCPSEVVLVSDSSASTWIRIPDKMHPCKIHVLLTVFDTGTPVLKTYKRYIIDVVSSER